MRLKDPHQCLICGPLSLRCLDAQIPDDPTCTFLLDTSPSPRHIAPLRSITTTTVVPRSTKPPGNVVGVRGWRCHRRTRRPGKHRFEPKSRNPQSEKVLTSKKPKATIFLSVSGRRYYSPELGRWISRDPIGEKGGVNILAFTGNSPINRIDVLGKWFGNKKRACKNAGGSWQKKAKKCCCGGKKFDPNSNCCSSSSELVDHCDASTGVKVCYRKSGLIWHAYLQTGGDNWDNAWTMGWAGSPYSELNSEISQEEKVEAKRECFLLKRKSEDALPNGMPCLCAKSKDIQDCVKNKDNWPDWSLDDYGMAWSSCGHQNCGDWVKEVGNNCCLDVSHVHGLFDIWLY